MTIQEAFQKYENGEADGEIFENFSETEIMLYDFQVSQELSTQNLINSIGGVI